MAVKRLGAQTWAILADAYRRFYAHGCPSMAAATSFYTLLSLVPMALLAISIFGQILGAREVQDRIAALMHQAVPGSGAQIRVLASRESRWFVNGVGLFGLLWSGMNLLSSLSSFLTRAWGGAPGARTFWGQKLVALAAMAAAGTLFFLSVVVASLASSLSRHRERLGVLWDYLTLLDLPASFLFSLLVSVVMFYLLYRFLPAAPVSSRAALVGALAGGALWHVTRGLFAVLVANSARYGRIYGPLAGVVVFMLWMYYSAMVLLFCAEIAAAYQSRFLSSTPPVAEGPRRPAAEP
jgi:membrane protein